MAEQRDVPLLGEPDRVHFAQCVVMAPDNPNVPKGDRTWNHVFTQPYAKGCGRCMMAWRLQGEDVGNHFHPLAPGKDPEEFVFLLGSVDIVLTDVYGDTRTLEIRVQEGGAPVYCSIPPYILHRFVVLSPKALFIEFQPEAFDPANTFSADEFAEFAKQFR